MAGKAIKVSTYERITKLTIARLEKIKTSVEEIKSFAAPLNATQIKTLSTLNTEVQKKCLDFELNFQRVVESADSQDISDETLSLHQDKVNDLRAEIVSSIEVLIPQEDVPLSPPSRSDSSIAQTPICSVRLPKLDLNKFSGDLNNWLSFINLFDTTIHRNASLSAVVKFQYLVSVLNGEPLGLVKSLSLTAANYHIAYNLLRERYHNPRRLTTLHINQILDLPNISASSTKALRHFVNLFTEHSQALRALECDLMQNANPLLSALLLRKMDNNLCKKLEQTRSAEMASHTLPGVDEIIKFLNTECNQVEDASLHSPSNTGKPRTNTSTSKKGNFSPRDVAMIATQDKPVIGSSSQQNEPSCFCCKRSGHKIYSCAAFKNKSPSERFNIVKNESRCVSCLGTHNVKDCRSKVTCKTCQKRHHSLLHFFQPAHEKNTHSDSQTNVPHSTSNQPQSDPVSTNCSGSSNSANSTSVAMTSQGHTSLLNNCSTVLLGTLLVKLKTSEGHTHVFRALLDSGSMCHLISERAAQILNTQRHPSDVRLSGLAQSVTCNRGALYLNIETLSGRTLATNQEMIILNNLTVDLPRTPISPEVFKRTTRYILADPTFHLPGPIDVVLGGAIFPQILINKQFSLGPNLPYVLGTHFGYVIMGAAPCAPLTPVGLNASLLSTCDTDLHSSLQRFWQQEEPPVFKQKTEEEERCDEHFASTHSRDSVGRYIVRLPFKEDSRCLGSSHTIAERRLFSLERKFAAQPLFSQLYHNFMTEYDNLGHMTKVTDMDLSIPHYFLPHHGVLKESSTTTKLRTVFDASSKTSTGLSLNDTLLTGRKLQTSIPDILMHFRSYKYVFSCDIRQMYRQITVHPDDRAFQLILWRNDPDQPITTYHLNTVTYGMNSSPYLAIKTLHQLAADEGEHFPTAAHVLRTQSYVDDIISGADTEEEAEELQSQLIGLLRKGGFELRKWVSNSPSLLQTLPEAHLESPVFLQESNQPHFSILGLHWSPTTDCFTYSLQWPLEIQPTKRSVLSSIAKIYDPCGFLAPCIMLTKVFMQFLWSSGVSWDEPLEPELAKKWQNFVNDAHHIEKISIPRAFHFSLSCAIEIHGFADASESGYAAVVYFRCQLTNDQVVVCPVIAKTRVAPLKRITLPRLELCAAHLLAQLVSHCQSVFKGRINVNDLFLWSDSSVALTWLRTPPYRLKTYVANRVAQTQELVHPESWRHISSSENPADCASRGILASQLVNHPLWCTGPSWLQLPHCNWPTPHFTPVDLTSNEEVKQTPRPVLTAATQEEWDLLSRFSSWNRLQRIMAYILRFVHNVRSNVHLKGPLSLLELTDSRRKIFQIIQQSAFAEDISQLKRQRECSTKLQRLKPFTGTDGLLRVGGRLGLTSLPQDVRHPILLPKSHSVVDLLVDNYHISNLHAGPQLMQSLLAKSVWILCARSVIRSRIFKCLVCFKNKPRNKTPLMGELPLARVTPARPFLSTGMDFAGPFNLKILNLRSIRHLKAYICIFICMVTKAVHIEVVTDLTTEAFIASLTRLVSRRGLCMDLFSDCGTNFIGADTALRRILDTSVYSTKAKETIHRFSTCKGMKFHFNPPAAPHQGGLWESAVKSAKHHLRRVIGETVLTLPEFITLTTQVEAMLNSRPLTPLSNDPSDLSALTPGHFLIGAPLVAVPEQDFLDVPQNRLRHWQQVQAFHQRIWERWHLEYIHTLHQRVKWTRSSDNLKVGDLVLMQTPSAPLSWPLARVIAVHPGADGIVRVVKLKTANGNFTRPAGKVYPLPID